MKFRRETKPVQKETIKNDDLLLLLASVYSQLDNEMLLHSVRCAAHLYAAQNGLSPRTVYDGLFKEEQTNEEWDDWMKNFNGNSRGGQ